MKQRKLHICGIAAMTALLLCVQPWSVCAEDSMEILPETLWNTEPDGHTEEVMPEALLPVTVGVSTSDHIRIMLDPGHFGSYYNASTVVKGYYESVMNWKLSNYLKTELEALGVEVGMTKSTLDEDPLLKERGFASQGYDFFLSLHSNASSSAYEDYPMAICYQDLKWTTIDDTSREVGQLLTDTVTEVMGTRQKGIIWGKLGTKDFDGNGVLDDEWYTVLSGARYVRTPGVLMEHSFHTNYNATIWLMNDENLKKLAKREAEVLTAYFTEKKAKEQLIICKGDVDEDGMVSVEDAARVLHYYASERVKGRSAEILNGNAIATADFNNDGEITVEDAVCILQYYAEVSAGQNEFA